MAFAQRNAIIAALRHNGGNVTLAARQLRIGRATLYRLVKAYDIRPASHDGHPTDASADAGEEARRSRIVFMNDAWYLTTERR